MANPTGFKCIIKAIASSLVSPFKKVEEKNNILLVTIKMANERNAANCKLNCTKLPSELKLHLFENLPDTGGMGIIVSAPSGIRIEAENKCIAGSVLGHENKVGSSSLRNYLIDNIGLIKILTALL